MKMRLGFLAGIVLTASLQAAPITYIYTGTGSGTVGTTAFTDASFTVTALADTDNLTHDEWGTPMLPHNSTSIDIAGVGTFSIDTPLRTFIATSPGVVGLSRNAGGDLFDSGRENDLRNWDLIDPIGPVSSGNWVLMQWTLEGSDPISTSGGILNFNDASSVSGSFQAVVPEPASVGTLAAIAATSLLKRRRK